MKEFDENTAAGQMLDSLGPDRRKLFSIDDAIEVIDLIYDYYEEAGLTEIDDDDDTDIEDERRGAVGYVTRLLAADRQAPAFTPEDIAAMVAAEMNYEESLI